MPARKQAPKMFRVQFLIDGDSYTVFPLRGVHPEVASRAYRFKKHGPQGAASLSCYDVRLSTQGVAECERKGFLRWGRCRHIKTLVAFGCFPPQGPVVRPATKPKQPAAVTEPELQPVA